MITAYTNLRTWSLNLRCLASVIVPLPSKSPARHVFSTSIERHNLLSLQSLQDHQSIPRYCHKMRLPSLRFHRCKPDLIEEVTPQVDRIDRTRVREQFNKGFYMLSISFDFRRYDSLMQDSLGLSQVKSRDLSLENRYATKPVFWHSTNSTG